jgi:hypothetical protein
VFRYRNRSTRQVVEREQRDARLDHLSHRWELIEHPAVDEPDPVEQPEQPADAPAPEQPTRRASPPRGRAARSRSTTAASRSTR